MSCFGKWDEGLFFGDIFILEIWWDIFEEENSNIGLEFRERLRLKLEIDLGVMSEGDG